MFLFWFWFYFYLAYTFYVISFLYNENLNFFLTFFSEFFNYFMFFYWGQYLQRTQQQNKNHKTSQTIPKAMAQATEQKKTKATLNNPPTKLDELHETKEKSTNRNKEI